MSNLAQVIGIRELGALDLVQTLLQRGVSVRIRASGNSMRPLLTGEETIELSPLAGNIPQLGDILFIHDQQNNPFVHRLIWRRSSNGVLYLLTKGDACAGFDGFTPANKVIGRVQRIICADSGRVICLQTPFMRWQAMQIVGRALLVHTWRKIKSPLKTYGKNIWISLSIR